MQHISTASDIKIETRSKGFERPRVLSLYHEPPQQELTLDEFEMLSLERLQLLRNIEILRTRNLDEKAERQKIDELERKFLSNKASQDVSSRLSAVERDRVSHFIMRLAYCRTEDLRRWFLAQECALLKNRLEMLSDEDRAAFMHENGFEFEQVTSEEKSARTDLLCGLTGVTHLTVSRTTYYKVPFQQALTLVSSRAVYLERGFAFVPLQRLMSIIIFRFRAFLSHALVDAANMFDRVGSDTRIGPLLKNMNKQFIGNDFTKQQHSTEALTADQVDLAAQVNMPLCMKHLHNNLKRDHKLKHWGRLQYGLFLKGAGLDLDGAMAFWESHFTKLMNHDQFVKSYAYSFRHMYGKEGARKNYTPYSCMKIIMGTPPEVGAFHGCPYRHMPDNQLVSLLGSLKLSGPDVTEIAALAKTSNYQLACQKHFDVVHPGHLSMDLKITDSVANHPNQWFQASVNYHKVKSGKSLDESAVVAKIAAPPTATTTGEVATTAVEPSVAATAAAIVGGM